MPTIDAPDLEALGTFVHNCRNGLGLTQTQLANRVGWVQEGISILEHGKYGTPSLPILARLAAALDTSLAEVIQAAGYTDLTVSNSGQPEARRQSPPVGFAPQASREPQSGNDTVETQGLSILLDSQTKVAYLRLALRCNQHSYHATIQSAGSDWLLTLLDDERATIADMRGEVLTTQEDAVMRAMLGVLEANSV
jgi:transcriptional regulator with XRE-family HTH domain